MYLVIWSNGHAHALEDFAAAELAVAAARELWTGLGLDAREIRVYDEDKALTYADLCDPGLPAGAGPWCVVAWDDGGTPEVVYCRGREEAAHYLGALLAAHDGAEPEYLVLPPESRVPWR